MKFNFTFFIKKTNERVREQILWYTESVILKCSNSEKTISKRNRQIRHPTYYLSSLLHTDEMIIKKIVPYVISNAKESSAQSHWVSLSYAPSTQLQSATAEIYRAASFKAHFYLLTFNRDNRAFIEKKLKKSVHCVLTVRVCSFEYFRYGRNTRCCRKP